jgi:UrcA family protein
MTTLRFGFPLAIALAMASAAAVAQQADQMPNDKNEAVKVERTTRSYTGIPIEHLEVDRPVSYANLDLTTPSGAAELKRRIAEAAKEACQQLDTADPFDLSDTDDFSCVKAATGSALKQANAAIVAARTNSSTRATT